jgi:hypothetical protein
MRTRHELMQAIVPRDAGSLELFFRELLGAHDIHTSHGLMHATKNTKTFRAQALLSISP